MDDPELATLSYLWDGSDTDWCLRITHHHERRLVLPFDPPGPSAADVATMRAVFDEFRARTVQDMWTDLKDKQRIELAEIFSPLNGQRLVADAERRGLRVEVIANERVVYLPLNTRTQQALLIEREALAAQVAERMRAAGVPCQRIEVD